MLLPAMPAVAQPGMVFEKGFLPTQDLTVWRLEIAHGYPLVRAKVGNVQGVFILDTGTPWGLLLNSAQVRLPDAKPVFTGSTGSGQTLHFHRSDTMPPLQVQGLAWPNVRDVHSADLSFVEQGTGMGPFLGFIGAHFFAASELTLDYARRVAMVRRLHPDTGAPLVALPAALTGGVVVTSVGYRGDRPSFPVFDATLGDMPVRVMLDSGNPGASIDATWLDELRQAGLAKPFSLIDQGAVTYRASPMLLGGMTVAVQDLSSHEAPAMVDGQVDRQLVRIGFSLLRQFGVTWNYRLQTMTFFTP